MRLGLVGRGPQAQRYLDPRNGGNAVVSQVPGHVGAPEYQDWLRTVDGVIIATHPVGHRQLALAAIWAGKPVLIEKPLALTLEDCLEVIESAERADVPLEVAHTHLWHEQFPSHLIGATHASCNVTYSHHDRDYSAWLDWGPHVLAMLEATRAPEVGWSFSQGPRREMRLSVMGERGRQARIYTGREAYSLPPMLHMLREFAAGNTWGYDFQRRVYRALFAYEEKLHGTEEDRRERDTEPDPAAE